jgi:hypothetical protein
VQVKNPKTGEVLELESGQWVPVAKAPMQEGKQERLSRGPIDAAMVGAGDTLTTWGRNARDMWAGLRGDDAEQLSIADERAEADLIRNRLHEEAPLAAGIGSALPALATLPLGLGVGAGRLGALGADVATGTGGRLASAAAMSAGQGALGSQSGQLGVDALEGLAWAGGGSLASNMVSRVKAGRAAMAETRAAQAEQQAAGAGLDDAQRGVIEGAQRSGMRVTPGQALNDPSMRQMEASAASNPVLSPYWQQLKQENAQQINRLTAQAMGETADNVGADVRAAAEHRIGQQFEEIGRRIGQVDTAPLKKRLAELAEEESTALLPRVELESILNRFERGATARAGAVADEGADLVTGPALMRERSRISTEMRSAYQRSDATLGNLYGDVLDAMDDAVRKSAGRTLGSSSAGRSVAQDYDKARSQWSVLRALDRGGVTPDGQVLTGKLAGNLGKSDKSGFWGRADEAGETTLRRGTGVPGEDAVGDLYDGLRFATSRLGKDIVGDSGTATRLATSGMFEGGLLPTIGRAGAHVARRAVVGPLARRYMDMSPEAAQAWQAAVRQSGMAGWMAGNAGGVAAGRAGSAILSPEEAGPYLDPREYGGAP